MDGSPTRRPGRLPPGQTLTRKFPVVGEKTASPETLDLERWRLLVDGLVERPCSLSYDEVRSLPSCEITVDLHCVTGWTRAATRIEGVPLASLLDRVGPRPDAAFVRFVAYSPRDHDTSLPLDVARADTWLVYACDGEPLAPEHGYPLRTLTTSRYLYKSLKWVRRIELLAEDRLGYWERESSYHNNGDPWAGNERFRTGSIAPERLAKFRVAGDYTPYRGPKKIILGGDLSEWAPATRDLGDLHLKFCDLRRARLDGADLRGANLSLSDLRQASLVGADLTDADLEGANLAGADLTGADLSRAAMSATRFFETREDGTTLEAQVTSLRWRDTVGLLEDQQRFLEDRAGA